MKDILMGLKKDRLISGLSIILLSGLIILVSILVINTYVKSSVRNRIINGDEAKLLDVDCILILGAGVWEGNRPSFMLEDRLLTGINLYRLGVSDRLLMSGDNGREDYDEVNVMKNFAIDKGIVSEHIFMDHAGFSTYESLYRARDVFDVERLVIVTQEYHIYRALYIAEKLGLEAYGVASNPREYMGQDIRDFRESLARLKDFFKVIYKPKPTYLGDTLSVNGNGDLTNDK